MSSGIVTKHGVVVTPKVAQELLDQPHIKQRPLRQSLVRRYAAAMSRGEWNADSPQGLIIDPSGKLLNGQHRLAAVIMSGATVKMTVSYNVPEDVFDTLDTGAKRTGGDIFAAAGYNNGNQISAIVRQVIAYDELPGLVWTGTAYQEAVASEVRVLQVFEEDPERYQEAGRIGNYIKSHLALSGTAVGALHYLASRISTDSNKNIDEFIHGIATGESLKKGDPRLQVRRMFLKKRDDKRSAGRQYQLAVLLKAWNAFVEGRELRQLRWAADERMPIIVKGTRGHLSPWVTE